MSIVPKTRIRVYEKRAVIRAHTSATVILVFREIVVAEVALT